MTSRFSHSCNQSILVVISADDFKFIHWNSVMCDHDEVSNFFFPLFYYGWIKTVIFDSMVVIVWWCLALFFLKINIRKPLKHEYITHRRSCLTSPKASRLDGFVVPRRSPSYFSIIDPKQKKSSIIMSSKSSLLFSYKPLLDGIEKIKRKPWITKIYQYFWNWRFYVCCLPIMGGPWDT